MREVDEIQRYPSPMVTPQALAWDGTQLWMSSRDRGTLSRVDVDGWKVVEEIDPPGVVWAAVPGNDGWRFTIGEGPNDDRYIYRYADGEGFVKLFACPDFAGSYLSFDGGHLYLSQWYKERILKMDEQGKILREIKVGAEICGHTFVDPFIYVLRGREKPEESWRIARLDLREENPQVEDLATIPFASRSLAFDGRKFWSNHRAGNEVVSFHLPG